MESGPFRPASFLALVERLVDLFGARLDDVGGCARITTPRRLIDAESSRAGLGHGPEGVAPPLPVDPRVETTEPTSGRAKATA